MSIAFALIFVNCTNAEEAAAAPSGSGDSEPEVPVLPETVKILAIGNSFSADAVEQELYGLFEAVGQKVVIDIRLERAKDLLVDSRRSIAEIGQLVGIPNTNHFLYLFKKREGIIS